MKMQTRVIALDDLGGALAGDGSVAEATMVQSDEDSSSCPRCSNDAPVRLDKADPMSNTCYRCRTCGHIFSPRD
jgi:predicted RNA-binding Zn-ribbon protein involved in translation (DUF1610 family)